MTEPEYHKQPHTQDPTKEPPDEDAPLAQGHTRDTAADVAAAAAEHKQAVEEEAETEDVGPRDPGDHAGQDNPSSDETTYADYPSDGTVDDVLTWVDSDHDRAQYAISQEEQRSTPRTTLISQLNEV